MPMHADFKHTEGKPVFIEAHGTDFDAIVQEVWGAALALNETVSVLLNNIKLRINPELEIGSAKRKAAIDFESEVVRKVHPDFIETLKQANQPLDYAKDNCFIISLLRGSEARFFHPGQIRYISSNDRACPK